MEKEYNSKTSDENLARQIEQKHEQLVNIRKEKISGCIVRARANRIEFGEKPSKYFLQLENSSYINKTIKELELDDGTTIRKQDDILSEVRNFYTKLYSELERSEPLHTTQRANVRTMNVHCTYKPVHTDLVRITFGMKVFWTYGSVRTMYVHSRTYNVRTLYVHCTYSPIPKLN